MVFAPWQCWPALPAQGFPEQARDLIARLAGQPDPARPLNPLMLKTLADKPPGNLTELAKRYREVLVAIDQEWQTLLAQATASGMAAPTVLPDADREELRQVLYGVDAALNGPFGRSVLEPLPDRASQEARDKLLKPVVEWRAKGPRTLPRAMVLEDAAPSKSRTFSSRQSEPVPRPHRAAAVLADLEVQPIVSHSRTARAGWIWPTRLPTSAIR